MINKLLTLWSVALVARLGDVVIASVMTGLLTPRLRLWVVGNTFRKQDGMFFVGGS